jgi:hypothetical protein
VLVPRARERSGVDGALGQIMAAGSHASGGTEGTPSARSPASGAPVATEPPPGDAVPDAAAAAVVPDEIADASADAAASESDASLDAGDAGDDDDDDDDDEVDASHPAALLPAPPRAAGPAAVPHPVTKRPRAAPGVKHKGPRRHKRPRRR